MSETRLKLKVLKELKNRYPYAWVYKAADRFRSGIPDILMCYKGAFIAIELKTSAGVATKLQLHELDMIVRAGGNSRVCRSVREVVEFIEAIDLYM